MHIVLTCFVVIVFLLYTMYVLRAKSERFEQEDKGKCNCCKCGMISCEECSKNRLKCCEGQSLSFDRYTFATVA